jgi:hypothetical protein
MMELVNHGQQASNCNSIPNFNRVAAVPPDLTCVLSKNNPILV